MNEKNFEYLTDQLKFTGFGKDSNRQLKENMAQDSEEFRLEHTTAYGKDQLSSSLHFKKSAQGDLYFFNSYTASLKSIIRRLSANRPFMCINRHQPSRRRRHLIFWTE